MPTTLPRDWVCSHVATWCLDHMTSPLTCLTLEGGIAMTFTSKHFKRCSWCVRTLPPVTSLNYDWWPRARVRWRRDDVARRPAAPGACAMPSPEITSGLEVTRPTFKLCQPPFLGGYCKIGLDRPFPAAHVHWSSSITIRGWVSGGTPLSDLFHRGFCTLSY